MQLGKRFVSDALSGRLRIRKFSQHVVDWDGAYKLYAINRPAKSRGAMIKSVTGYDMLFEISHSLGLVEGWEMV